MSSVAFSQPLQRAILRAIDTWSSARGQVAFPCIPQQFENYVRRFQLLFESLGRPFSPRELTQFANAYKQQLDRGARQGRNLLVTVNYEPGKPPHRGLVCRSSIVDLNREKASSEGVISLPCIPQARSLYEGRLAHVFSALGHPLEPKEVEQIGQKLEQKLRLGFEQSPYSRLIVRYARNPQAPREFLCGIEVLEQSIDDRARSLVGNDDRLLFGSAADAKVRDIAAKLQPEHGPVLDIGAGTGRNAIALARSGFAVDAVDLSAAFLERLSETARQESLSVNTIKGDILDPEWTPERDRYQWVVAASVLPHLKTVEQLGQVMSKLCDSLRSPGQLLVNLFISKDDYEPDPLVLELAHVLDSFLVTRSQWEATIAPLPLQVISDESVVDYEKNHLPPENWPPTPWFQNWATGRRLFPVEQGKPPTELRWILLQKS